MAATTKTKGRDLIISMSRDGLTFETAGLATSCAIEISADTTEVASNDARAKAFKAGRYSWSVSSDRVYDAAFDEGDNNDTAKIFYYLQEGALVHVRFETAEHAAYGVVYEGQAIVTHMSINAPVEGYASVSVQMQGSGPLSTL